MTVTINAAQLVRLIDKTVDHAGTEYIEQLHGIRLDKDATHLHAIASDRYTLASDRYTLAVARYKLADAELKGEPFARTIPLSWVKPLREWLQAMEGSQYVTISTDTSRLNFATADTELRVPVSDSLEFPNWRGILYTITGQTSEADTFPVLDSRFLARWSGADGHLHMRVSTDRSAVLLFGEDFIGAQMPARHGTFGSCTEATFDQARDLWAWTLAGGAPGDMEDMPVEERSGWEASTDPRETGKGLLQHILRSSSDIQGTWRSDPELFNALIGVVVHGWMAYRYLEGLHQADPRRAREIVAEVAEELDDGELAEWAWDTAEKAGHDPKQWAEDYQNAQAKKAGETRTRFTERLAEALNEARMAGVAFTAEDNPLVRLDEQRDEWTPVPAEPAA